MFLFGSKWWHFLVWAGLGVIIFLFLSGEVVAPA
jgi:hypothetical protein